MKLLGNVHICDEDFCVLANHVFDEDPGCGRAVTFRVSFFGGSARLPRAAMIPYIFAAV